MFPLIKCFWTQKKQKNQQISLQTPTQEIEEVCRIEDDFVLISGTKMDPQQSFTSVTENDGCSFASFTESDSHPSTPSFAESIPRSPPSYFADSVSCLLIHPFAGKDLKSSISLEKSNYLLFPSKSDIEYHQLIEMLAVAKNAPMPKEFYQLYKAQYTRGIFDTLSQFGISESDLYEYENRSSISIGYALKFRTGSWNSDTQVEDFFSAPDLFSENYGPAYDELRISQSLYHSLHIRNKALFQEIRSVFYSLISITETKIALISQKKSGDSIRITKLYRNMNSLKENLRFWKQIVLFVIERRKFLTIQMNCVSQEFQPSLEESRILGPLILNFYCFL